MLLAIWDQCYPSPDTSEHTQVLYFTYSGGGKADLTYFTYFQQPSSKAVNFWTLEA